LEEAGCLEWLSVVSFFISKSCWVAMSGLSLRENTKYTSAERVYDLEHNPTYRADVPGKE